MIKICLRSLFLSVIAIQSLSGCVSNTAPHSGQAKNIDKVRLPDPALKDYYILRADMHSMNGDWLKAQMDLENAIRIESTGELKLRHSLVLAQRGLLEESEKELKEIINYPEMKSNVEAHLALGEVLALRNNAEESLTIYKQALKLEPKNYKAIIFLGAIYSQLKNFNQAQVYFNKLKEIEDYKHLSGYYLGRLSQQLENYKQSEIHFEECLKIKPDFTDCIFSLVESLTLQNKNIKAIDKLNDFIEVNPDSDRAYAKLYDLYLEENQQDKAFQQLVQLERFEPQNRYIKMQMALHFVEKNENDLAIEKLNEVAQLSPDFGKTYFILSTIYERKGDFKKSKYYYSKISKKQPIYIEASIQRAKDIENKEGAEKALKFLNSVQNSSEDSRVGLYQAILYNRLNDSTKSVKILRSVAKKNPDDLQILYFLGHLEGEIGEMGRAVLNMKRILQIDPNHSDALNYLAFYYAESKILLDEAEKLSLRAIQIKSDDGHYYDTLGWIYYQKGQLELAQKYLEKAFSLNPEEAVIAEHLASVYSVKGLKEKAVQVYTQLIEKGIGDREKFKRQINSISEPK